MKRPAPELQNTRIISLATQVFLMPFRLPGLLYRALKGLVQGLKSDKRLRAEDQTRQSRVRRGLRGLSPDHVQKSPTATVPAKN